MHQRPRRRGSMLLAVLATVVLLLAGCGVVGQGMTAQPTDAVPSPHPAGHTALAETPDGRHTIGWQVDGLRRNELGRLWRPKYFHPDGIALHGFSSVPATPSSHGCVRLTVPAMNFVWANDIAPEGSTVWVYGRAP